MRVRHATPCLGWGGWTGRIYKQVPVISGSRRRAGGLANEGWEADSFKNESWNEGWNEGWLRGAGFLKNLYDIGRLIRDTAETSRVGVVGTPTVVA